MKKTNIALASAMTGLIALAGTLASTSAVAADMGKEKCYGVSKAGKNDCATKTSSCAGSAKEDAQKDAFVVVPKGLCDRLHGGSTKEA
ncbi:hypothetical protein AYY19_16265 [Photobacterium aquimaris]|uniref:DUF2282 domain-containing protein n=2 Tax=Photobacterium TaxID=657 RepID=A0A2T3IHG1_9GAMM|nr:MULTISPECIES: DUF2282 domain-containing protein [Photobacterium]OBU16063.1 hypothetical protein AYY19_16265 [Photobacterium aquimaris]OBU21150.1 hypothetical protein AYY20_15070 [Photobacterium aquimaris]PSU27020.1 DUF2282 domain-containing protein [Photobacterium aquimaris]PSV98418.1 DUF2282 domain-containing protein [Photobacterium aquimaris]SMY38915.1 hypothetical protein PMAL9190_03770 [Photobacterium malacitanum]